MFYYLRGTLALNEDNTAVVDCGGVGYRMAVSAMTAARLERVGVGETVTVYTYMAFRQEAVELFGFYDRQELESFKTLLGVNGVGPKAAMNILSVMTPDNLALAICTEDVKAISKAPGIGAKTAARIVLELKDKLAKELGDGISLKKSGSKPVTVIPTGNLSEATEALMVLGYDKNSVLRALDGIDPKTEVGEIIRFALKKLAR